MVYVCVHPSGRRFHVLVRRSNGRRMKELCRSELTSSATSVHLRRLFDKLR